MTARRGACAERIFDGGILMVKTMTAAAALGALVVLGAPLANAQTSSSQPATSSSQTGSSAGQAGQTIRPDQVRASKMIGSTVYDTQNQKIGDVRDIVLDKSGQVADVVIGVGGFLGVGSKDVAVKYSDIKDDNDRLTLSKTKDELSKAETFNLENKENGAGSSTSPVQGGRLGGGSSAGGATSPATGGAASPSTRP
jgi:sporulation protein YlmC with PRC-barrel domain